MIIQNQQLPNGENFEVVIVEHKDGSITSMPKSVYDEQQKALKDAAN